MISVAGRNYKLVKAPWHHFCTMCPDFIEPSNYYFSVTYNNGGLKGRIYPDRVHVACFQAYLDKNVNGKEEGKYEP